MTQTRTDRRVDLILGEINDLRIFSNRMKTRDNQLRPFIRNAVRLQNADRDAFKANLDGLKELTEIRRDVIEKIFEECE